MIWLARLRRLLPKGILTSEGILPGIKVDTGAKPLAGSPDERITEGLDGLRDRLSEYRGMGARFAKWRAVIRIADGLPSAGCMSANAHALGRYAALCQEQHLLPIVEPEVLMDGSRYHSSAMQIPKYMAGYQNRQSAQWNNIAVRVNYLWKVAVKFWEATTSISAHLRRPELVPCGDLRPPPDPAPA